MIDPGQPIPKDATQRIRLQGKVWDVPVVLPFWHGPSGLIRSNWRIVQVVRWGCPLRGEYYLSGAKVEAWKAPNDLSQEFLIVRPGPKVRAESFWVLAEGDDEA